MPMIKVKAEYIELTNKMSSETDLSKWIELKREQLWLLTHPITTE